MIWLLGVPLLCFLISCAVEREVERVHGPVSGQNWKLPHGIVVAYFEHDNETDTWFLCIYEQRERRWYTSDLPWVGSTNV